MGWWGCGDRDIVGDCGGVMVGLLNVVVGLHVGLVGCRKSSMIVFVGC